MVLRTFATEEELYKKFKAVCSREGANVGDKLNEFIQEYLKEHGDGNPNYALTQWSENPEFMATPALFRKISDWEAYTKALHGRKDWQTMRDIETQCASINRLIGAWYKK